MLKQFLIASVTIAAMAAFGTEAKAQFGGPSISQQYRNLRINRPTVSPYLGLFERTGSSTTPYYSFVKPRIDQEAANRQMQQQTAELRQQLNQVSVQANAQQQQGRLPTGHRTTYMYYSHYFTMPQSR